VCLYVRVFREFQREREERESRRERETATQEEEEEEEEEEGKKQENTATTNRLPEQQREKSIDPRKVGPGLVSAMVSRVMAKEIRLLGM
jgi:ATPase subunit of ABC transporter with duplicated ATPase domains